jgi:hypothetical protein
MSNHTPGKWYAGRIDAVSYHAEDVESGPYKNVYVDDPNGKMHMGSRLPAVVCEVFGALGADCRTNAAYIVRCVNAHEALLAALKRAHKLLVENMHVDLGFEKRTRNEIIDKHADIVAIRAAIALAESLP